MMLRELVEICFLLVSNGKVGVCLKNAERAEQYGVIANNNQNSNINFSRTALSQYEDGKHVNNIRDTHAGKSDIASILQLYR